MNHPFELNRATALLDAVDRSLPDIRIGRSSPDGGAHTATAGGERS